MTRRTKVMLLVLTGVFMASLDLFIVNIAFPAIRADYPQSSFGGLSWILNAYAIVFAAALVPAGRWWDRLGRKRGFLIGVALFTLGSALCAAAPSVNALVAARVLQAVGAACLMPTSLGLLLPEFPPEGRAKAIALWAAAGGVAAAAGPPIGGLLVEVSWRLVFLVNVPIGIAAVMWGRSLLREIKDPNPGPTPDTLGAVLCFLTIGILTWSIVAAPDHGWASAQTLGGFAVSLALGAAFVLRSRRHAAPVVPPEVVAVPNFRWANLSTLAFFAGFATMLLTGVLVLTGPWGFSVILAGLALAPGPMTAATTARFGGALAERYGARTVATTGALIFSLGPIYWSLFITSTPHYWTAMLPGQLLTGFGVGLVLPSLPAAAFGSLVPSQLSTGIGIYGMSRQVGSALGIALLVAVIGHPTPAGTLGALRHGWYLMIGFAALAALLAQPITRPVAPAEQTPAQAEAALDRELAVEATELLA